MTDPILILLSATLIGAFGGFGCGIGSQLFRYITKKHEMDITK